MSDITIDTNALLGKTSEDATDTHIEEWQKNLKALKFDKNLVDVAINDLRAVKDLTLDAAAKKLDSYFNQVDNGKIDYGDQVALAEKEDENSDGFVTANMENDVLELPDEENSRRRSNEIEDETGIFSEFFSKEGWKDYEEDPEAFKEDFLDYLAELMDSDSAEYQEIEDFIDNSDTSYAVMKKLFEFVAGDDDILTQSDLDNFKAGTLLANGPDGETTLSAYLKYQDYLDMGLPQKEIERRLKLEPGEKPEPGDPLPVFTDEERAAAIERTEDKKQSMREMDLEGIKQHLGFGHKLLADGGEGALDAAEKIKVQLEQDIRRIFAESFDASKTVMTFIENNNFEKVLDFFDNLQTLNGSDELELEDFDILKEKSFTINDDGSIHLTGS